MKKRLIDDLIYGNSAVDSVYDMNMKQHAIRTTSHHDRLRDITYEIMKEISGYGYNYNSSKVNHPDQLYGMLSTLLNDDRLMVRFFSDPKILDYVRHIAARRDFKVNKTQIDDVPENERNGILHVDYDTAIDMVEAFDELGIDNLDEEQLEEYQENLDIVKQYER